MHTIPYVEPRRGASGGTAGQMAAQTAAAAKLPCLPMLQQSQCPFSPLTQEKHFQTLFHLTWPLEYIQLITVHKASSRPILTRWQRSWTNSTRPRTYFGTNINQTNSQEAVYSLSILSSIFYIPYISILSAGQADDVQDRPGQMSVSSAHMYAPKIPIAIYWSHQDGESDWGPTPRLQDDSGQIGTVPRWHMLHGCTDRHPAYTWLYLLILIVTCDIHFLKLYGY